jgi:hypothetical protein
MLGPVGGFCTGTLIADNWVLTAGHCDPGAAVSVVFGDDLHPPVVSVAAVRVVHHSELDIMLVEIPTLEKSEPSFPLGVADEPVQTRLVGAVAQLAGYGETETESVGVLKFLASQIAAVDDSWIIVDGRGHSGACVGDSGGPLLLFGKDASIRVAGILSQGDASCLGNDRYVRTDILAQWIAAYVQQASTGNTDCHGIDKVGVCQGFRNVWCDNDRLIAADCTEEQACGWDAHAGYRCVNPAEDPCRGVSLTGVCTKEEYVRCDNGILVEQDCAGCGEECINSPLDGRAECAAPL